MASAQGGVGDADKDTGIADNQVVHPYPERTFFFIAGASTPKRQYLARAPPDVREDGLPRPPSGGERHSRTAESQHGCPKRPLPSSPASSGDYKLDTSCCGTGDRLRRYFRIVLRKAMVMPRSQRGSYSYAVLTSVRSASSIMSASSSFSNGSLVRHPFHQGGEGFFYQRHTPSARSERDQAIEEPGAEDISARVIRPASRAWSSRRR